MLQVVKRDFGTYVSIFKLEFFFLKDRTRLIQFKKLWLAYTPNKSPLFLSQPFWKKKFVSKYLKYGTTTKPIKVRGMQ